MDVTNGEVLAMASLPTYDANKAKTITNEALFNRATLGVYEQGSTFKIFNTAMALDSGKVTLIERVRRHARRSRSTASRSTTTMRSVGRSPCRRSSPTRRTSARPRWRSEIGQEAQKAFFDKIGFLKPLTTQLPELAAPLWPRHWVKINTMTIAYGHGISVTPLHLATGSAAMVNGGILYPPSLVKRTAASDPGRRVIQAKTSG